MPALQKKHKKSSVHNIKSVMTLDMVRGTGLEFKKNRFLQLIPSNF